MLLVFILQADLEIQNLQRKLKLMEGDLDSAEDKCADASTKLKDMEAQVEELTRENKQQTHRIQVLEGMFITCHDMWLDWSSSMCGRVKVVK